MKKVLSVFLSLVMLLSITSAADISAYALTSGDWQYGIVSGGVSITGYKGSDTEITVPTKLGSLSATVVSVSSEAFAKNTSLVSVEIPDGISIGNSIFSGCSNLKKVILPDSITAIPQNTFFGCTSLETIDLPANLTSIGSIAFGGCIALQKIDIPESVSNIDSMAFATCDSLTEFTIPDGITEIKQGVLAGCRHLKKVTIPSSVKSIGPIAFSLCSSLSDVYFLGTREEWNNVKIDQFTTSDFDANDPLLNAAIHCLDDPKIAITVMPSGIGSSVINGTEVLDDEVTIEVFENADVTITATPVDGAVFTGWSVDGKLISTAETIAVKALADITYVPVFQAASDIFTVMFTDKYGNIFSTQQVSSGAEIDFDSVKAPVFAGYTFVGWSVTPEEAASITGPVSIKAQYKKDMSVGYKVKALGCKITTADGKEAWNTLDGIAYDTLVTVYREDITSWLLNGAVVAYGNTYTFYVGSDVELDPSNDAVVAVPTVAAVSVTEINDGGVIKASFLATRSMTPDCTYINSGFLYGKNLEDDDITLADVKAGSAVKAHYSATDAQQFALTYSLEAQTGKMTARAFLAYADANGATKVIYAAPQTYTYAEK